MLELKNIHQCYGETQVLKGMDLLISAGKITGLIGTNGAGKTTLMRVIAGVEKVKAGELVFLNQTITQKKPHVRSRLGIKRSFQHTSLVSELSILENTFLGAPRVDAKTVEDAKRLLDRFQINNVDQPISQCSLYEQKCTELVRALLHKTKVLLLDEPAAGLNHDETKKMGELIQSLKAEDLAILLVEHDMSLVMSVCDSVAVLNDGAILFQGSPKETQANEQVRDIYLGHAIV